MGLWVRVPPWLPNTINMNKNINLKIGDLIIWNDGCIGILYEKVDLYTHIKAASRKYNPRWRWLIKFSGEVPRNYSSNIGVAEEKLLDGTFGKIINSN